MVNHCSFPTFHILRFTKYHYFCNAIDTRRRLCGSSSHKEKSPRHGPTVLSCHGDDISKTHSDCKINKMNRLNLPPYEIKTRQQDGRQYILDVLRRKFIALTPEEWVRQHFIHFLADHKGYPTALLANEVELTIGGKKLRCDSVLYSRDLKPRMIIEYKAPSIAISQKTFNQIFAYNTLLHADDLVVSNGISHYCCKIDYTNRSYSFLSDIPRYEDL